MNKFKLSIIIPTWNRKKKLIKLLKTILIKLNKVNINYEIHICDSYSNDGTRTALENLYGTNHKIFFHNIISNNISSKRNKGLRNAKFDNILLLDDDCVPIGNFFNILIKSLNSSKKNEIFCAQYYTQKKLVKKSNYYRFRDSKNLNNKNIGQISYKNIITGSCFFKITKQKRNFYFNENIKGYGLEDVDWAFNLKKRKFKLFLTKAIVDHQETSQNIKSYVLKWYMMSRDAMPSLLKKNNIKIKGKLFIFEKIFKYDFVKLIIRFLNPFIIIPLSITLKFLLFYTDKSKFFYSQNLFYFLLMLYYLRGACNRNRHGFKNMKWYKDGYK